MRKFGVKLPSEKVMRTALGEWKIGQDIICEKTPFQFTKDKIFFVRADPMAYLKDLKEHVLQYLDSLYE